MNTSASTSPYQIALMLLQGLSWPALMGGAAYIVRFFIKADRTLTQASDKFDEIHKAVTNHLVHDMDEALQLLRKQDVRFETWMVTQAAVAKQAQAHHGV